MSLSLKNLQQFHAINNFTLSDTFSQWDTLLYFTDKTFFFFTLPKNILNAAHLIQYLYSVVLRCLLQHNVER